MAKEKPLTHQVVWKKAVDASADPERVGHFLNELGQDPRVDQLRNASEEEVRILCALLSGSRAAGELLVANPEWLEMLTPENLEYPRQEQGLRREVKGWVQPGLVAKDYSGIMRELRRFRQREMCRIAARDLARLGDTNQTVREISNLADVCLGQVLTMSRQRLIERFGEPYHQTPDGQWTPTPFAVLGLGKLGGQELNYSSDVDVMFLYGEEGSAFREPPRKGKTGTPTLNNHQFFRRLAEAFIAEVTLAAPEGMLYRMDLRLRPEGDAGPLVRSLSSYENFYAQWGQTWERMMLIKARCVAGDCAVAGEFLEIIQPFRFPRYLSERALHEMAAMKRRTEAEVVRSGELDRNVKLGRGGIREIEFIAQTAQILHAGRIPFLQGHQTLPTLQKMVQYDLLKEEEAKALTVAYCFLRDVEHRVQMDQNLQTHTIPEDVGARRRLARLMGKRNETEFEAARRNHCQNVRRIYDRQLAGAAVPTMPDWPRDIENQGEVWRKILGDHSFRDPEHSVRLLTEFVLGPGYVHVSSRTTDLAWELVPKLLVLCPGSGADKEIQEFDPTAKWLSDPDRVLARLDRFIGVYGARAVLFETWAHNPSYFELLLLLFDRSEFLAETAIRTPDLVDDLVQSGRLNRGKSAEETLADLLFGIKDQDQYLWLRRYHQAELTRIGLRDILGLADFEHSLEELTNLADACLQYAMEVVLRKHRLRKAPFVIVGLGKLGGRELNFGSDLDIVFIADSKVKNLPALQKLAVEVMDLISSRTEQGLAFETDARLRPDGEKGLLVNTLEAFEEYYRTRAQLWEIQALSRTRAVAGDIDLGDRFQKLVGALTNFTPENVAGDFCGPGLAIESKARGNSRKNGRTTSGLAAYKPDWKQQIDRMRRRVEKERTPAGQQELAIKTGEGGLMDAEFIAQAMCLAHGWQEANTLKALERLSDSGVLSPADAQSLIHQYRQLRRIEGILRRWSLEGETELPMESAPYQRVAVRCGFSHADAFRDALGGWRKEMRRIYKIIFPPADEIGIAP